MYHTNVRLSWGNWASGMQEPPVLSSQFFCKSKAVLKNKVYLKINTILKLNDNSFLHTEKNLWLLK